MPYDDNHAECPCCQKKAEGSEDIERLFGYRTMADGKVIPQSYCRACRSARCEGDKPCKVKK